MGRKSNNYIIRNLSTHEPSITFRSPLEVTSRLRQLIHDGADANDYGVESVAEIYVSSDTMREDYHAWYGHDWMRGHKEADCVIHPSLSQGPC